MKTLLWVIINVHHFHTQRCTKYRIQFVSAEIDYSWPSSNGYHTHYARLLSSDFTRCLLLVCRWRWTGWCKCYVSEWVSEWYVRGWRDVEALWNDGWVLRSADENCLYETSSTSSQSVHPTQRPPTGSLSYRYHSHDHDTHSLSV